MRKITALAVILMLSIVLCVPGNAADTYNWDKFRDQNITLNIYNWGLYISDGTDESLDVVKEFEDKTGIKVVYTTYDTNESMYSKLNSGGGDYDLIVPSDYMIGKMAKENMLAKLNFDNIPNYKFIGDTYKNQSYDKNNEYSIPYTWGVVGIVYNTTMVNGEITSWNSLWDAQYSGRILMFNNSRDAYAIAAKKIGKSINPSSAEDLKLLNEELKTQKPFVQAYVMDEIFDKMESGEAAMAPYYAGDAITMMSENEDLAFCIPEEGTNYFVDAMCIPKQSRNKEAAEMFINFMCETEIAAANCEFIGYSTPHTNARELLPEDIKNSPIAYPSSEILAKTETMSVLSDEMNLAVDAAWSELKSFSSAGNGWIIPVVLSAMFILSCISFYFRNRKKSRNIY